MDPSPTAEATRFTDPVRTSPTAKMPGRLVEDVEQKPEALLSVDPALKVGDRGFDFRSRNSLWLPRCLGTFGWLSVPVDLIPLVHGDASSAEDAKGGTARSILVQRSGGGVCHTAGGAFR